MTPDQMAAGLRHISAARITAFVFVNYEIALPIWLAISFT